MRMSDWSSDVCSSDLRGPAAGSAGADVGCGRTLYKGLYSGASVALVDRSLSRREARPHAGSRQRHFCAADAKFIRTIKGGFRQEPHGAGRPAPRWTFGCHRGQWRRLARSAVTGLAPGTRGVSDTAGPGLSSAFLVTVY